MKHPPCPPNFMANNFEYIRYYYNLPFLKRGQRVLYDAREGKVIGTHNAYLKVRVSDSKTPLILHPTWNITYIDKDGAMQGVFGK